MIHHDHNIITIRPMARSSTPTSPNRHTASKNVAIKSTMENSSSGDLPRSILRSPTVGRSGHRVQIRLDDRGRPERVSFNPEQQIFFIPTRRQLREEHARAIARRRLRSRLTMRRRRLVGRTRIRRTRTTRRRSTRTREPPRRSRLASARRRYVRSRRRHERATTGRSRENSGRSSSEPDNNNRDQAVDRDQDGRIEEVMTQRPIVVERRRSRRSVHNRPRRRRRRRIRSPPLSDENDQDR